MPRRRKKSLLEPIGKLLERVYPAPQQLEEARVFSWWGRAVPPRIVAHARPVRIVHGTLIVHVSSSVWAQELHYLSGDLLERLHSHAPQGLVKRIRFRVGPLPELRKSPARDEPPTEPLHLASLPDELGRALSRVHDDELREAITRAATTSLARQRTKRS